MKPLPKPLRSISLAVRDHSFNTISVDGESGIDTEYSKPF